MKRKYEKEPFGSLGEYLKCLRTIKALTLREAAKKLGCTHITIHLWEKNKAVPTPANIRQLAKVYDVSIESIVSYIPSK